MRIASFTTALLISLIGKALLLPLLSGCSTQPERATAVKTAPTLPKRTIRFDQRSPFQRVMVVDQGNLRLLQFGSQGKFIQSVMSLSDRRAIIHQYIRMALLGVLHNKRLQRVLMIGLGGGTFTTMLRQVFPDLWIDAVEIDPVVVQVAKQFFGVREDSRFRIHIDDGVEFLKRTTSRYQLIFVDAYGKDGPTQALTTRNFYRSVNERLSDRGVAVANLSVDPAVENILAERFREEFSDLQCGRTRRGSNIVLFGIKTGQLLGRSQLEREAQRFTKNRDLWFDLAAEARRIASECAARPDFNKYRNDQQIWRLPLKSIFVASITFKKFFQSGDLHL